MLQSPPLVAHVVPVGAVVDVRLHLGAAREDTRPVRLQLERELIGLRRDVDRYPRIPVVSPGAADVGGALQHDEVVDRRAPQSDRHPDSADARSDDGDFVIRLLTLDHPRELTAIT